MLGIAVGSVNLACKSLALFVQSRAPTHPNLRSLL
jgi:hypothetical protein